MPDGTLRRLRVPILMYHYVSELPPNADNLRVGLTVSPAMFREHLAYLAAREYQTITLYQLYLALTQGLPLPPNPVVLTFDDGYTDHLYNVVPAMLEHGFVGTFFIITSFTDEFRPGYVTWDDVNQIAAAGMEIASHTKTHPDIRGKSYDFLVYELLGSIESVQAHTGVPAYTFAYPMGSYDDAAIDMLRQTGIKAAVTTQHGATHTTDGVLELRRLRIQNTTGIPGLEVLLREP